MGTFGYCAPEYARNGNISLTFNVYGSGIVLLELITGRRAIDTTKPTNDQNLVTWVQLMFKYQKRDRQLEAPVLENNFPLKALNQAVAIVVMCVQEKQSMLQFMSNIVTLRFFAKAFPSSEEMPSSPDQTELSHNSNLGFGLSYSYSLFQLCLAYINYVLLHILFQLCCSCIYYISDLFCYFLKFYFICEYL